MTQIKHHLTAPLLMGYAAGTLPEAFDLVVATHVSMCDDCRAALAEYDALGGEVMLDATPANMDTNALAATFALIDKGVDAPVPHQYRRGVFPAPLQDYVAGDVTAVKWRKIGGGVSQMLLNTSGTATVRLLKISAGTTLPDHGHRGIELTMVLQGAFYDHTDRFTAGDVEVANEDLNHTPIAEAGVDCICLAATDAPLRFSGVIPRLVQRFSGI
tara:strand:- start:5566 stop:6210 length:645 start_codon:yes stop_codon:yes gene_type:complete